MLPASWNDLRTRFEGDPEKVRSNFKYFEDELVSARVVPMDFGLPLDRMTNIAVQVALFAPEHLASYLVPLEAPAQAILRSRKRTLDKLHLPRFAALAACNLAALAGARWGQIAPQKALAKLAALPKWEEVDTQRPFGETASLTSPRTCWSRARIAAASASKSSTCSMP